MTLDNYWHNSPLWFPQSSRRTRLSVTMKEYKSECAVEIKVHVKRMFTPGEATASGYIPQKQILRQRVTFQKFAGKCSQKRGEVSSLQPAGGAKQEHSLLLNPPLMYNWVYTRLSISLWLRSVPR